MERARITSVVLGALALGSATSCGGKPGLGRRVDAVEAVTRDSGCGGSEIACADDRKLDVRSRGTPDHGEAPPPPRVETGLRFACAMTEDGFVSCWGGGGHGKLGGTRTDHDQPARGHASR